MSFSAEAFCERPSKNPRFSVSIHHDHFSSAKTHSSHGSASFLHHHFPHQHQPYNSSLTRKELTIIKNNVCHRNSISAATSNGVSSSADPASSKTCSAVCSLHPPLQTCLWSALPHELIERILAFLPVSSLFRFGAVCKSWHSLLFSRPFLSLRSQLPWHPCKHGAYFLALNRSRYQQLSAYEATSKKWYDFPLDFLPAVAYPVTSAGGLICFVSSNSNTGAAALIVCNPLTRKWKELPSMALCNRVAMVISMMVDREGMAYKILVVGGLEGASSKWGTTEMYESETGKWVRCGALPEEEEMGRTMVEYGGHCLSLRKGQLGSGLLAFNLQKRIWMKVMTGRLPGYAKFRHLVECGGSILVIGKALRRYVLGLSIWCLDVQTQIWKEIGKMPHAISDQFFSSPSECFYCAAQGNLIFFGRYFYNQGLIYNTVENSWQQVSGCPLLTHPLLLPFDPGLDPVD